VIQLYRRTSPTQPFEKAGIPTTEADYHNSVAEQEYQKSTIHPQRQKDFQIVFIQFKDDEELPKELTYDEALERAYKP